MRRIILASGSPWRRKLLSWLGVDFEVRVSEFDEKRVDERNPKKLVQVLAEKKAETVAGELEQGVVIGADTVIVIDDKVLGKPEDIDHAREILLSLRGREHFVYSGVCVMDVVSKKRKVQVDVTRMEFKEFTNEDLKEYLSTGDSLGKAGAYQFLKIVDKFVDEFEGSVSGVIGLPIKRLIKMLDKIGLIIDVDSEKVMLERIGYKD